MATTAARLDTDAVARQRLGNFGQGKEHTTEDHDGRRCPPLCIPATARYFWLPASMGGGSSLSLHPEERAASMNDLVLDLVIVYVISNIVAQGDAIVKREQRTNVTLLSPSYMAPEQEHPPDHLVFRTMFEMFTIYVPIYFHWFSLARLENAFGRDDIVHTCKWIINMLLLVQLAGWLQVCREEQICGNYAGWMSAGKFFHVICLQYYRVYNHTHHSFQLHEESLYTGIVACGWMAVSFYMPAEVDEVEPVWFLAIFVSMAIFDLVRFTDFLPLNKKRGVFSMCASLCSSQSRRHAPMNLPLLVERQNLFAILCLGEMAITILAHPWFEMQSEDAKIMRGSIGRFSKISSFLLILLMIRFEILDDGEKPGASAGIKEDNHVGFRHAFNASHQRGVFYCLFTMLANFGILLVPASMDLYALGGTKTVNLFADPARALMSLGCVWFTVCTSLQHLTHSVKTGHRRVSPGMRFGLRLLASALFFLVYVLPWRLTSTLSYAFNPDILYPLSIVLVQAVALAVDMWSVAPAAQWRQRSSSLRDGLLQIGRKDDDGVMSDDGNNKDKDNAAKE